jgi:biotin transport system substrate-specific component
MPTHVQPGASAFLHPAACSVGDVGAAVVRVAVSAAALALAAQVRVPVPGSDVPMTLQLLAVLLIGFSLRPSEAVAAVLLYLACGAAGAPVFAAGSLGLVGPTGGYLVGFAAAAWVMGLMAGGRHTHIVRLIVIGLIGVGIVLGFGVGWKLVFTGGKLPLALATGFVPFWWKAVLEVGVAVAARSSWSGVRQRIGSSSGK